MNKTTGTVAGFLVVLLAGVGCSSNKPTDEKGMLRDRKYDYRFAEHPPRITVPKGLSSDALVDLYVVPPLSPYAGSDYIYQLPLPPEAVAANRAAVKIQRMGDREWILTSFSPSQLWPRLKEFIAKQGLSTLQQNGAMGIIKAYQGADVYIFKLQQGFQRNTSELTIKPAPGPDDSISEKAYDQSKKFTEEAAQYLADLADKPTYSYAARGISTQKKMQVVQDNTGQKQLLLNVDKTRGLASLRDALESASFKVESVDKVSPDLSVLKVEYYPVVADEDKPGFWGKLIGKPADGFDKNAPYAGHKYTVTMRTVKGEQLINVELPFDEALKEAEKDPNRVRDEVNHAVLLIKSHLS